MPELDCAIRCIKVYEDNFLDIPNPEWPMHQFEKRLKERCGVDMLISFLTENWYSDTPVDLICEFIDEMRYNIAKYCGGSMANFFFIVKETAEALLDLFL